MAVKVQQLLCNTLTDDITTHDQKMAAYLRESPKGIARLFSGVRKLFGGTRRPSRRSRRA